MNNTNEVRLTSFQAYKAMYCFLNEYYRRFKFDPPDDLAIMLGSMRILDNGTSADSAQMEDWKKCVLKILKEEQ